MNRFEGVMLAICLFGGILIGFADGRIRGETDVKQEAIKKGLAHWVADDNGKAEFKWNVDNNVYLKIRLTNFSNQ